jgi:L-alanine-DL-glutamate epimerase-like enolase superfamily enzyme
VKLTAWDERWPIAGAFTIARGAKTEAHVIVAQMEHAGCVGRGEAVPYPRYGETVEAALAELADLAAAVEAGLDREALQSRLPAGATRNALDCAFWDLQAKLTGVPAWRLAGRARLDPVKTCYTISLGEPQAMADQARQNARRPMLKLKIGGPGDLDRVAAVRMAAPKARLLVDANEALTFDELSHLAPEFARLEVKLIEQPLPAGKDQELEGFRSPVPLCADESLHTRDDLESCASRYHFVNIKLDKTGGLTDAVALVDDARRMGMGIMAGCMVATSLAMAPAIIFAQGAEVVDLDGPLLLAEDRKPGLKFDGSLIYPPAPELWG